MTETLDRRRPTDRGLPLLIWRARRGLVPLRRNATFASMLTCCTQQNITLRYRVPRPCPLAGRHLLALPTRQRSGDELRNGPRSACSSLSAFGGSFSIWWSSRWRRTACGTRAGTIYQCIEPRLFPNISRHPRSHRASTPRARIRGAPADT